MGNEINSRGEKMIIMIDDLVVEFAATMSLGMKAVTAAAQTYVTALRKYPSKARAVFAERFPSIRKETWELLEEIGHGNLPPQTMMMTNGAIQKLREAKIPRRMLSVIAESKVEVYNPTTDSYELVQFSHITSGQAEILLNPVTHGIRTKLQQKRYVVRSANSVKAIVPKKLMDYAVVSDGVVFKRGAKVTFDELERIVSEHHAQG